jgi:hypothetical protein
MFSLVAAVTILPREWLSLRARATFPTYYINAMPSYTDETEYDWRKSGRWKYDWVKHRKHLVRAKKKLKLHVTHTELLPDYCDRNREIKLRARQEYHTPNNETPSRKADKEFSHTVRISNSISSSPKLSLFQLAYIRLQDFDTHNSAPISSLYNNP